MRILTLLVLLSVGSCAVLKAETLVLSNGRQFVDARVISQNPLYVTVRHASGFTQVAKALLPETWREKYPVDPAAAAVDAEAAKKRLAQARIKIEQPTLPGPIPTRVEVEADKSVAEQERDTALALANAKVESYYRTEWRPNLAPIEVSIVEMKIAKLEQPSGWSGQWTFSGEGSVDYTTVVKSVEPTSPLRYQTFSRALVGFDGVIENGECTIKHHLIRIVPLAPRRVVTDAR